MPSGNVNYPVAFFLYYILQLTHYQSVTSYVRIQLRDTSKITESNPSKFYGLGPLGTPSSDQRNIVCEF